VIGIEDIECMLQIEIEFGHSVPEFAFVNPAIIHNIFEKGISAGYAPNPHYGFSGFALWTRIGRLELVPCPYFSDSEVVFSCSRNMILNVFNKLGLEYGKNSVHR
jgi:hypothetical protein